MNQGQIDDVESLQRKVHTSRYWGPSFGVAQYPLKAATYQWIRYRGKRWPVRKHTRPKQGFKEWQWTGAYEVILPFGY